MQASAIPAKIQLAFANGGSKNTIPVASQIGVTPGAASYTDGFPPLTRTPLAAGGVPPSGADMNGILNAVTAIQQWQSAGGLFKFDAAFSTAIGGYPKGCVLASSAGLRSWLNTVDQNTTDPDSASASGWVSTLGSLAGADASLANISASASIPASAIGKVLAVGGSTAQTLTLPDASLLPDGASLSLYSQNAISGGASYTIAGFNSQNIVVTAAFASTTTLAPGDMLTLTVRSGAWLMSSGATGISLSRMAAFNSSKSAFGYQKLPSGIILQWGQFSQNDNGSAVAWNVSLPIAFPSGGLQAFLTPGNAVPTSGSGTVEVIGTSTMSGFTSANTATRTWRYLAIGY